MYGKLREGKGSILEQVCFLLPGVIKFFRKAVILPAVFPGIVLRFVLVKVGTDFTVNFLYVGNAGFQFCRGLVLQVSR